ncbi:SO2930 family diheme c-type cytochrome [Aquiflexum lacus]|uniref:SO2930 family diheme c-type cytochrome n=1 Tax=Aquiflexum lacus TaxID=2483805 RepID=UPI001894C881|nr:SO2930 family diheme c-type cytochrome [Aquiflexum lacus]
MKFSQPYFPAGIFFISLILGFGCSGEKGQEKTVEERAQIEYTDAPDINIASIDFNQIPFKTLSEYGFFKGQLRALDPSGKLVNYEPSSSLFTDYAFKSRYIWMPEGTSAKINQDVGGSFDFPDQTIIIKNFYYPVDFRNPEGEKRVIETRLMVKRQGIWEAFPYIWKDDQTEAEYKVVGAEKEVSWTDQNGNEKVINYIVPNKNQCKSCHNENEVMVPIGVKAKYLNHSIQFGKESKNQLVKWSEAGYLENIQDLNHYTAMVDYSDGSQPLELRAKAYLDINCAHCHRAEGPASTSGLFLDYEETDPMKLGVFKTPVAAGFGAGSFKYAIYPGKADESIMTFRMSTNKVGAAMPEIGRVSVHKEGVELIREWINGMK